MRRLAVVAAVWTVVVFVVGRISVQVPANAEGRGEQGAGAGTPKGNGDVNGDGNIDISDGVYILNWLFLGGKAPVGIECNSCCPPVCPPERLPATGQTRCYGVQGEFDCADFPGQDGFYKAGCPTAGRFVDNGDGTVTDNCTELMWQKDTADVNGDGTGDSADYTDWGGALKYCESLSFAGQDDWRLPNIRELQSIVDYSRLDPSIDPVFNPPSVEYWSSTPFYEQRGTGIGWGVNFGKGWVGYAGNEVYHSHVRAVRTIQLGE